MKKLSFASMGLLLVSALLSCGANNDHSAGSAAAGGGDLQKNSIGNIRYCTYPKPAPGCTPPPPRKPR
jgi:hypothetical protein